MHKLKGTKQTEEHKKNIGEANRGKRRTKEARLKMSLVRKSKCIKLSQEEIDRRTETRRKNGWFKNRKKTIQKMSDGNAHALLGKAVSKETRLKRSKSLSGENNPNWQGGKTSVNEKIRQNIEYKLWRELVYERDDYTCQKCLERGYRLNAHHILNFSDNESIRFNIDNGITLCKECHKEFHDLYGYNKNTMKQIIKFLT